MISKSDSSKAELSIITASVAILAIFGPVIYIFLEEFLKLNFSINFYLIVSHFIDVTILIIACFVIPDNQWSYFAMLAPLMILSSMQ